MVQSAHLKPLAWACPQAAGTSTLVQEPGELAQFHVWDSTAELRQTSSVKILNYQRLKYSWENNSKLLHRAHHMPDVALNNLHLLTHLTPRKTGDYFRRSLSVGLIIELGWIIKMQNLIKPNFKEKSDMKTLRETLRSFIPQIFMECLFWTRRCSRTWE